MRVILPEIADADLGYFQRLLPELNYEWLCDNWRHQYYMDDALWVRVEPEGFQAFLEQTAQPRSLPSLVAYAEYLVR